MYVYTHSGVNEAKQHELELCVFIIIHPTVTVNFQ